MTNPPPHLWWQNLPAINAILNGVSALFLLAGFIMIKRGKYIAHATLIIIALVTSAAFLTCYLIFHIFKKLHGEGITHFPDGRWRPWYLALLLSHTFLAFLILPLIFGSVWLAWKRRWHLHHKVSSVTFPLWFYVSVTGVIVYWALYHLAPTLTQ